MGCDIHMYTEVNKSISGNEQWVNSDNWRLNPYWEGVHDDDEPEYEISALYRERNYSLFAALAGVRDYSEGTPSMGDPKGLPNDTCSHIKKESDSWGSDGHSHSYWTLRELREFQDKHKTIKHSGFITEDAAKKLDSGEETPNSWCQGSSRPMEYREWEEECEILKPVIDALDERMRDVLCIWDKEEHFDMEEKIRIVFWFDN